MSRLIRCVITREKKNPKERFILLAALAGDIERVEKTLGGTISVEDPTLTEEEGYSIANNFPHFGHGKGKAAPLPFELPKAAELPTEEIEHIAVHVDKIDEFIDDLKHIGVEFKVSEPSIEPKKVEVILENQNVTESVQPAKRGRKPKQQ